LNDRTLYYPSVVHRDINPFAAGELVMESEVDIAHSA